MISISVCVASESKTRSEETVIKSGAAALWRRSDDVKTRRRLLSSGF